MIPLSSDFHRNLSTEYNKPVDLTPNREAVTREACNLSAQYNGPTHITRITDGVSLRFKYCPVANEYMSVIHFHTIPENSKFASYDGLSPICDRYVTWYQGQPTCTSFFREILGIFSTVSVAEKDTNDKLLECLIYQEGYCYLSKRPLLQSNIRFVWINPDSVIAVCADLPEYMLSSYLVEKSSQHVPKFYRVESKILVEGAKLPQRKRSTDAAYDIFAFADVQIEPQSYSPVSTGVAVCAPPNTYFTIENRSSLSAKGIVPFRGIIDSSYQNELLVILQNNSKVPFQVHAGDRIAQLILHEQYNADFVIVHDFSPLKDGRITDGFGSSGMREFK